MDKQAARKPLKSGGDTELTVREGTFADLDAPGHTREESYGPLLSRTGKSSTLRQSNEKWIREQKKTLQMVGFDLACARVQEKYEADYKPEPERGTCEYRIWRAKVSYESTSVQIIIALLIFANFVINAAEAQNPDSTDPIGNGIFLFFEYFFCIVFGLELIWNMAANWPCQFWCGDAAGWNWFDFIVVVVSCISLIASEVSDTEVPGVAVLRLLRAFRVFRLFKRLNSLRKIIKSIEGAMPGVANAFMILLLIMSIYAILGVELARDVHPRGEVYFGTFGKSLLSMFQVMTGESWSEAIARPLVVGPNGHWGFAFYFISYILICSFMMVNVAIAVLLEKFVEDDENDDDGGFQEITPLEAIDQLRGQLFPLRDKFTELNDRMDEVLRVVQSKSKKASNRQPQRGRPGAPKQTSRGRTRTLSSDRLQQ